MGALVDLIELVVQCLLSILSPIVFVAKYGVFLVKTMFDILVNVHQWVGWLPLNLVSIIVCFFVIAIIYQVLEFIK